MRRRGDNIPTIADYSHWNEEAAAVWYAENKYDMEYADEIIEDDEEPYDEEEVDFPFYAEFATPEERDAFADNLIGDWSMTSYASKKYGRIYSVEHCDKRFPDNKWLEPWT